jgi:hypothetical protein
MNTIFFPAGSSECGKILYSCPHISPIFPLTFGTKASPLVEAQHYTLVAATSQKQPKNQMGHYPSNAAHH